MSANNGNRSRFHIDRKRRIARLNLTRALAKSIEEKRAAGATESSPKQKDSGSTPGAK